MPIQPMTPTGVQLKLDELYALPDSALQAEAEALRADYQGWITANFSLTTEEQTNLANLNAKFVEYVAFNSAFAMEFRLPIPLTTINPQAASKLVRTASALVVTNDDTGGITASGSFNYEFEYL